MYKFKENLTTYNSKTGEWSSIPFSKEERVDLIERLKKLPGDQDLDSRIHQVQAVGKKWQETGLYIDLVEGTRDWISFWEREKKRCYEGVLIDNDYYITGDHYFYLNFIPIPIKQDNDVTLPYIFDTDIWMFQSVELAELTDKFTTWVKKRQIGVSLKFLAKILKRYWFEKGFSGRVAAWDEKYVNEAWSILDQNANHLNTHTGWFRNNSGQRKNWIEYIEMEDGTKRGLFSKLKGITYKNNPAAVVSGKVDEIYLEEAGVAPNLDQVLEYARPALQWGDQITGYVHIAGAVGNLKQSKPLKDISDSPEANNMLGFPNVWSGHDRLTCGFIPEEYSYGKCIDENGNSLLQAAVDRIEELAELEKQKSYKSYMIYKSQRPRTIEDAFASREENDFPVHIIQPHYDWVIHNYKPMDVTLHEAEYGFMHKIGSKYPIVEEHPVKRASNKNGCIVIDEAPHPNAPFGLYYAGVDTVSPVAGSTTVSLQSIYIYKAAHEINGEYSEEKIVAWYTGRREDPYETYRVTRELIKYYNARALIENNNRNFLEWMIKEREQVHIMRKSDAPISKDMVIKAYTNSDYGLYISIEMKKYLLSLVVEYVTEVIDVRYDDKTGKSQDIYGVTRIKDKMLLREMLDWKPKSNNDRIDAFGLTLLAAKSNTNRGLKVQSKSKEVKKVVNYSRTMSRSALGRRRTRSPFL